MNDEHNKAEIKWSRHLIKQVIGTQFNSSILKQLAYIYIYIHNNRIGRKELKQHGINQLNYNNKYKLTERFS